jgi:3-oxoacyl-[acyl-carrier protein] reductase
MTGRLQDKVALITGASRGIGRATALKMASEGAKVAVNYSVNRDAADEVVRTITEAGGEAVAFQANVGDAEQVEALGKQVLEHFGRVDILVNNAGIGQRGNVLTMDVDALDRLIAVNVKGAIRCIQAVGPSMVENGGGRIVNVASIAGIGTSLAENTPYAGSKAMLIGLTRRFALDLGPHNITVNTVCPGYIRTDMTSGSDPQRVAYITDRTVLGRMGEPEEIAGPIAFLASDEASFMTGQIVVVDGGRIDYLSHSG